MPVDEVHDLQDGFPVPARLVGPQVEVFFQQLPPDMGIGPDRMIGFSEQGGSFVGNFHKIYESNKFYADGTKPSGKNSFPEKFFIFCDMY